ncbi:hypothetical protein E2C01_036468 [Portunus trituberculatus]|uniref:Uncharacterized protein n=1 Tax=Portunus trituberculatus TaxID=210409 RepID=A0A5B7FB92_PORTR|nr:hypothetical protein [Portunus trituberculatus]
MKTCPVPTPVNVPRSSIRGTEETRPQKCWKPLPGCSLTDQPWQEGQVTEVAGCQLAVMPVLVREPDAIHYTESRQPGSRGWDISQCAAAASLAQGYVLILCRGEARRERRGWLTGKGEVADTLTYA